MIPKASQRGGGQDLATHLLNAFDNEYVELADVRGAVAHDLHGAFAHSSDCGRPFHVIVGAHSSASWAPVPG